MSTRTRTLCSRIICVMLALSLLGGYLPPARASEAGPDAAQSQTEPVPEETAPSDTASPAPEETAPAPEPTPKPAGTRKVELKVSAAANCRIYYSEKRYGTDLSPELTELKEGETLSLSEMAWPYGVIFFAAPEEGYALSAMTAPGSQGNYFTISDGWADGTGCHFLQSYSNYKNLIEKAGYTKTELTQAVTQAIALGCDGAMFFSRGTADTGDIRSDLLFYAEKLPTLDKRILSVTDSRTGLSQPYTDGMSVGLGDQITYALDVTFYPLERKDFPVSYTDVTVIDPQTGNGEDNPVAITPPDDLARLTQPETVTAPVSYVITQADVEQGGVVNEAQLRYQYRSEHSSGQLATTSSAQAALTVHASVEYRYVSADPDRELPAALAALAPSDYTYHDQGSPVTTPLHPQTRYLDPRTGGTWLLTEETWYDGGVGAGGPAPGPERGRL